MNNAQSVCDALCAADAIEQAANADDLIQKLIALHEHPQRLKQQMKHASAVLQANQGTLLRCMDEVERILDRTHHARVDYCKY
jgi:3-deoxy-D-manno-octulosonic-acid transferase